jgi:dsDNA-specific endonuclease/ATPase MutS2
MSVSEADRKLWQAYVSDVTPLSHVHVTPTPAPVPRITPSVTQHVSPILDLHGMTLQDAHALVQSEISQSQHTFKYMTFITGKSGQMQKEFPDWLRHHPHVSRVDETNTGGAYKVWFKRTRHKHK